MAVSFARIATSVPPAAATAAPVLKPASRTARIEASANVVISTSCMPDAQTSASLSAGNVRKITPAAIASTRLAPSRAARMTTRSALSA